MELPINQIMNGDALIHLKKLPDNIVDAVICDPPYGLSFMNKKWDYDIPSIKIWIECFRIIKPGGHLLSFAGTRTYHRMTCNIEDAGFEIRDMISWIYGSGFPKSMNIGKQIKINSEWEGWGTTLKPACEPIVLARKPISENTIAQNCLRWETGGLNINECKIGIEPIKSSGDKKSLQIWKEQDGRDNKDLDLIENTPHWNIGRFPANVILDEQSGKILDEQSGISESKRLLMKGGKKDTVAFGNYNEINTIRGHNDCGGASRFFYCAKASKSERNEGLDKLEAKYQYEINKWTENDYRKGNGEKTTEPRKNNHPTVKPIKLMEYLVKLITKKNQIVLDPFLGSGTTAIACIRLNRNWIGIERESDYIKIAQERINYALHKNNYLKEKENER